MTCSPSRRSVLTALAAVSAATVPALADASALASHPDAELLRLGAEFDRCRAAYLPVSDESWRIEKVFEEEAAKRGLRPDSARTYELWNKLGVEIGFEDAAMKQNDFAERVDAVTTKIRETPAKTFAGLAVKARALRFDAGLDSQCLREDDSGGTGTLMDSEHG